MMLVSIIFMWVPAAVVRLSPAYFEFKERRENRKLMLQGEEDYSERFAPYMKGPQAPAKTPGNSNTGAT